MYIYIYICECVCGVGDITTMKLSSKVRGLSLVTVMRPCGQFFFHFSHGASRNARLGATSP